MKFTDIIEIHSITSSESLEAKNSGSSRDTREVQGLRVRPISIFGDAT